MNTRIAVATLVCLISLQVAAREPTNVTVIDRQSHATRYTYVVPWFTSTKTTGSSNCEFDRDLERCRDNRSTSSISVPGYLGSYELNGATLSLKLSDGRVAVVNCEPKVNWAMEGDGDYRSCRVPPVDAIQVDFSGDKAKLKWPVAVDNSKLRKETYRIVAILDAPELQSSR